MRNHNIYIITKELSEQLKFVDAAFSINVQRLEICKMIATGYQVKTENGAEIYVPFSKLDSYPITSDWNNLQLTAIVQAPTEKEAIKIAEEKMQSYINDWYEHLHEKEKEEQRGTPERW